MAAYPKEEFDELSVDKQIEHVQELWNRIAESASEIELTDSQKIELDRRLQNAEEGVGQTTSWEELKESLSNKP